MKKITLLFFLVFLSFSGYSQLTEGFENTTGPDLVSPTTPTPWTLDSGTPGNQWAVFDNGTGLTKRWDVITGANVYAGTNSAFIDTENINSGNTSEDYLATPLVTVPTNGQLRFWTRTGSNGDQGTLFQVKVALSTGTQINPADYALVQQWNETSLTTTFNSYQLKTVDLTSYVGQQVYIAFVRKYTQPTAQIGGDRWLIDNVQLVEQCLNPTALTATGVTFNGASLSWTSPGVTSWEIEVLPASDVPTGTGVVYSGALPYVVTGLLSNTAYQYFVRAICSGSNTSGWSGPTNFTTTTAPPICGGNYVDAGGTTAAYPVNSDSTVTICPITLGDKVTVTFTAFDVESGYDGLYVFNGNSITAPQISSANGAGNAGGAATAPGAYWGTTIPGPFTSTSADGCLTFRFRSDNLVQNQGWIANVTCAPPPTCTRPTTVITSGVTATTVNVAWTQPANPNASVATSWQVLALPCGSPLPTATSTGWVVAGTNPFVLTGLNADTCYTIYVRATCSPTDSSAWSVGANATTLITPPVCGGTYPDPGGANANYPNNADNTVTICPITPGDAVTVTFTSFNTQANTDGLYIFNGNSTAAPLISSGNAAGNVPGGLAGAFWGTANIGAFTSTSADGCLTFRFRSNATTNAAGWTSNVTCAPATNCPQPTVLTTSAVTYNSVTLGWTSAGTAWQVIAVPCGSPVPTATATGWVAAGTNPFVLTGLTSETCYDIYVRNVCSPTSLSAWTGPRTITTPITPPMCGGTYVDLGGLNGNYPNNADSTVTICPTTPGQQVTVTFTAFNTEEQWDALYVFNGNSTAAPQIPSTNGPGFVTGGLAGGYWGTTIPGPFTGESANGCLTFRFRSDGLFNFSGWVANVTCASPPTCPRPTTITVTGVTQTSAIIGWTETGSATQWEVLVLPVGSPIPTPATTGWLTANTNPFTYTGLASGTQFIVYVRAHCSDTDISNWSTGLVFATLITNDECANAIVVPVNPDTTCTQTVGGTVIGATASTQGNTCGGTDDDDVWFKFTATTTAHSISLNNVTGSTADLYHVLYTGTCGNLTQVYCSDPNESIATGLVPGQVYYIRVYTWTATPNQTSVFNVCVGTIPPPISATIAGYTNLQLIENVFLGNTCSNVTNITSSTGTNFGTGNNGIGYFNQNGSSFPFAEGIVLSTGNATSTPGPNNSNLSEGTDAWLGDADLEAIILAGTGNTMLSRNASKLEFDFVPLSNSINFDFIFASEEYGTFQCDTQYSDAFAFILTNVATGVTTNLAVVPNSTTPISVGTIRKQIYNTLCNDVNPLLFGQYNLLPQGVNPLAAPINFNGYTVPLTATSSVTPGSQYHIKMVIADRQDTAYDSAVFLKGGSLNIGNIQLGQDFLEANGTALCSDATYTIQSGLNPANYSFVWSQGTTILSETGPTLTVNTSGTYTLTASYINTTCSTSDSVTIEFYGPIVGGTPNNLTACNSLGYSQFDLFTNNASALGSLAASDYAVTYYLTNADAVAEVNPLPQLYTNVVQFLQTVYVRVERITTGCFTVQPFNLIVQDLTPQFTITPSFSICAGATGVITVTPGNYVNSDVTYSWTIDGAPLPDTTATISVTLAGDYEVTINNNGCTATGITTVDIVPVVIATFNPITGICQGSPSPAFPSTSIEGVTGTWSASSISTATSGTFTYTFTPSIGQCATNGTLSVTIDPLTTTTFNAIAPICKDSGTVPTLPTTSNEGVTGTWSPAIINVATVGTVNYTFTPTSGICSSTAILPITILPSPEFELSGGCQGNVYVLEATPLNNSFDPLAVTYTWTNQGGSIIGTSQTVTVTENGDYICTIVSASCTDSQVISADETNCVIQKGISPNGDGLNDSFELTGFAVKELSIFNRYGQKVYSKTNYTNQWFGQTDKGDDLPDGTYYFVIERVQGPTKSGWIYINRVK